MDEAYDYSDEGFSDTDRDEENFDRNGEGGDGLEEIKEEEDDEEG